MRKQSRDANPATLAVLPELRAFSRSRIARLAVPALVLSAVFAAFCALWRGDPWGGAVFAFVWLPAWLMPQVYVVNVDSIRREPAWLLGWRRRRRLDAGQIIAERGEVASWFLAEWRGHPTVVIHSTSDDTETVCLDDTASGCGLQMVVAWLEAGRATP